MISRFPSIGEHDGFYNLDSASYCAFLIEYGDESTENLQTSNQIPRLDKDEFKSAVAALYACFWNQAQKSGLSLDEAKCLYSFTVSGHMSDRTLQVLLPEPEALSIDFVQAIQSDMLLTRPLWRVLIRSEDDSRTVLVYPNVVRVGLTPADADWKNVLAFAIAKEAEHQD